MLKASALRPWLARLWVLPLLFVGHAALALEALPPPNAVVDTAHLLQPAETNAIAQKLLAYRERTGHALAVVIVPTTGEEDIAAYGIRLAEQWKLGKAKKDDGLMLIVAVNDRRVRIEVGYGLEGTVTDLWSKRIIDQDIAPSFWRHQYFEGINKALDHLIGLIDQDPAVLAEPMTSHATPSPHSHRPSILGVLVLFLLVAPFARALLGRPLGTVVSALLGGGLLFLVWSSLWLAIGGAVVAALFAAFSDAVSLGGPGALGRSGGLGGFGGYGGYGGGGFGGGLGGGGSDDGGFGGGGFGGGGASGSW